MRRSNLIFYTYLIVVCILSLCSCSDSIESIETQFSSLDPDESGVVFENNLKFVQDFNIYKYRNFYNGGGVGIGDVNNDGFVDIYFTANMKKKQTLPQQWGFDF